MTHAHRASSQEIKVRHMLKGKRARPKCIQQVKTPLWVSPLFLLCTGWQTASQSRLQSSIHREVDSPSPHGESQTISTLTLAFICFFLYPGNSDSCNTVWWATVLWDSHPEQAKAQALYYWRGKGELAGMKEPKGVQSKACLCYQRPLKCWDPGPWPPHSWNLWCPMNNEARLSTYMEGGSSPHDLDVKRGIMAPHEARLT